MHGLPAALRGAGAALQQGASPAVALAEAVADEPPLVVVSCTVAPAPDL